MNHKYCRAALFPLALATLASLGLAVFESRTVVERFQSRDVSIDLSLLPELTRSSSRDPDAVAWHAVVDACTVDVVFGTLEGGALFEPEAVMDVLAEYLPPPEKRATDPFAFEELTRRYSDPGHAAYVAIGRGEYGEGEERFAFFGLGGLLAESSYYVEVWCRPVPDESLEARILAFLRDGVTCSVPTRDHRWTDEEVEQRWKRDVPAGLEDEMKKPMRTPHFILLTNSSGGRLFCKKLEEAYRHIRKSYAFEEIEGQRLLPIFLFRTEEQYNAFCMQSFGMTHQAADGTKGIASRDFYATWYEAPNDPVHVHEITHQLFKNRLRLGGAGSWFQEGVAEYMATRKSGRGSAARLVKKGRHLPLREFVGLRSLYDASAAEDVKGTDVIGERYAQAALLIEFLRESRWGRDGFPAFLHAMGKVDRNDVEHIERVFVEIYGSTLEGVEEEWVRYCRKR